MRKAGEILRETPKHPGGQPAKEPVGTHDRLSTLKEIGVTKDQSSRYQKLASIPPEKFEEVAKGNLPVAVALKTESPKTDPLAGVEIIPDSRKWSCPNGHCPLTGRQANGYG